MSTTAPSLPAPTLEALCFYLKTRIERSARTGTSWCQTDREAVEALVAEVERRREGDGEG